MVMMRRPSAFYLGFRRTGLAQVMTGHETGSEPAQHAGAEHDRAGLQRVETAQGEAAAVAARQFGQRRAQRDCRWRSAGQRQCAREQP
jgi:hypothetical protein